MVQLEESAAGGSPKIGPVATDLLFENDEVKIWQMNRGLKETFWYHYHNYDYILFQITDLLGANDGEGGPQAGLGVAFAGGQRSGGAFFSKYSPSTEHVRVDRTSA